MALRIEFEDRSKGGVARGWFDERARSMFISKVDRRTFLKKAAGSGTAWVLAAHWARGNAQQPDHRAGFRPLARYVDELPRLKTLEPVETGRAGKLYRVKMVQCMHRMHSSLPPATVWGYEGQFPGPTFEVSRGEHVRVIWENHLPAKHLFDIDPHIHGAMPPAPQVRTVPHLHGSRSASDSDGLPEKWFTPGNSVRYVYPNDQQAATLWYHDHALGITRLNVYAGLAGFYLIRDDKERACNLPSGDYEIPLILQDRSFDDAGQLVYSPTHDDGLKIPSGVWGPEFFGQLPVINGTIYPFADVEPRPYRLRILNGSNSRFYNLLFNLAKKATDVPAFISFQQIGTDGGLLPAPVTLNRILLAPAERIDLIVDFSALEGKTVTLTNNAAAPYPGWGMLGKHTPPIDDLMQFRVNVPRKSTTKSFSMNGSSSLQSVKEADAVASRDFILVEHIDEQGHSLGVRINDKGYDDPVTEVVRLGTVEKWRFINTTEDAHPMHLHLVQFQILHKQGFDPVEFRKGHLAPVGGLRPPSPYEAGWKDTAVVLPSEMLTILVRFDGYTGKYVFHCHMLEHEDNDMMRPFEVTK